MTDIFYILLGMIALFFIFLVTKGLFKSLKENFCAICAAISLTWISLLVLDWIGIFENKVIIALLMGQSILGIYYILEGKVKEELKIFRLPFLLTLIVIGYSLLIISDDLVKDAVLLLLIWLIFILLYFYRNNRKMKHWITKIIECCKKW